jgi:hypothetical protein
MLYDSEESNIESGILFYKHLTSRGLVNNLLE